MKRILKFICAGTLGSALCMGFAACNDPGGQGQKEEGTEILPVPVNELSPEVTAFFRENFYKISRIVFAERGLPGTAPEFCTMINSADELPQVDLQGNPIVLPYIDFDAYTLVLGCALTTEGEYGIVNKRVVAESEKLIMYIRIERMFGERGGGTTGLSMISLWGLYPKLPDLPISVVRE